MLRLVRVIQRVEAFLIGGAILLMAAVTIGNVFSRALLGDSLTFSGELSQFLIVGITFIGLSYAAGRGRHIRMTAVYDQLPQRWRKRLMVAICASTSLLMLTLAAYSFRYIATVQFLGSVSPVLQAPLYLVYLIVPLGLLLTAAQYALAVYRNLTSEGVYLSYDAKDEYEEVIAGEI